MAEPRTDDDGVIVCLGNRAGIEVIPDPDDTEEQAAEEGRARNKIRQPLGKGKRCTTVNIPAGTSTIEALVTITTGNGVWVNHSDDDAPAWVASTDPRLASLLGEHYGCEVRDYAPDDGTEV